MSKISIGKYSFEYPVFPAPMCGVMDAPFRAMLLKFGTQLLYTEMIASHATILEHKKTYISQATLKDKEIGKNNIPFVIQLAGCSPEVMAEATKVAIDSGADIIDMNFGCPVKKIVNSFSGSALMKDEKLSAKIIQSVVNEASKSNIPVSIKMRMGWNAEHLNAVNIAKIAENEGVQMMAIHCRTRNQMYSGKADWSFCKTLKPEISIPIIVNGDINFENINEALDTSGADGAMIGRALYGKPWLIADCIDKLKQSNETKTQNFKTHKPNNIWDECIKEHLQRIFDFYPEKNATGFAIKNLYFYSKDLVGGANFRSQISKCNTKEEIMSNAESFFSKQ